MQRRFPEGVEPVEGIFSIDQIIHAREVAVLRGSVQLFALELGGEVIAHNKRLTTDADDMLVPAAAAIRAKTTGSGHRCPCHPVLVMVCPSETMHKSPS